MHFVDGEAVRGVPMVVAELTSEERPVSETGATLRHARGFGGGTSEVELSATPADGSRRGRRPR